MTSFVGDLYDGSAAIGRTTSAIGAVVVTIIAIIMIIIAIYILLHPSVYTQSTTATITSVDSSTPVSDANGKPTSQYNYSLHVSYAYQGQTYTNTLTTSSSALYKTNDTIQVMINPKDPSQFELPSSVSGKTVAWVLIGVSVLATSIGWIGYYLTRKSKAYAALTGIGDVASLFTHR